MKITIPHNLPREEILTRMKKVFQQLKEEYTEDVKIKEENWQGDTATFVVSATGIKLKGSMRLTDTNVEFDLQIPLMLKAFESQIRSEFENEFKKRIFK